MRYILYMYMIILFPALYQTDVAFNHLRSQHKVSSIKSPKQWKVYIDVFLARKIMNGQRGILILLTFFNKFQYGKKFVSLANRLVGSKQFDNQVKMEKPISILQSRPFFL